MASVDATMKAINEACRSKGGHYATYSCKVVSWDDVSRGTVGGSLSCWGANITDTYLKSKTGQRLFTVRSDNWNEKLGVVSADEVAVVASRAGGPLQPVTLRSVLQQMGTYGSYAGLEGQTDLSNTALDAQCSIRFQTTFIPVEKSSDGRGKLEFATEAYNYNTTSDSDPRNLVLLCTSQGMAVQQDGRGSKKLFHHAVEGNGKIHRYWLEAEESLHKVGGEQRESDQERAEALARGKATSSVIGIRAMGQRFNVLMTIQACMEDDLDDCMELASAPQPQLQSLQLMSRSSARRSAPAPKGLSSAARVSRGTEHDVWKGLSIKSPQRNGAEHVTVTVVIYNAVRGGVPTPDDVAAAIDDLEGLYRACSDTGRLADTKFDFMKEQLKVDDMIDITAKVAFQPPVVDVLQHDVFPAA
ncbi:unc-104 [Symbiodinium sp. CCMP2592]|nr:unc-104 [Symbiodinium sp. CCMP2592]